MSKSYFEMSATERQLHFASNNVNYAMCLFAEGLQGEFEGISTTGQIALQNSVVEYLAAADKIITLFKETCKEEKDV